MKTLLILLFSQLISAATIEVMSYNVENLFDTVHDKGKNDWTFMPNSKEKRKECSKVKSHYRKQECYETDWTEKHLAIKLNQIKNVILKERKKLPEILGLVEIENERVVGQLANVLGYKNYMVSNSPDYRGIDLAILYKDSKDFRFVNKREHALTGDYFKKRPTRNIFEVEFLIGGQYPLHIFVNHWPSLGNPDHARVAAATLLKSRIEEILKTNKKASAIAMGDFNTIPELKKKGNKHPYRNVLLKDSPVVDMHSTFHDNKKIDIKTKKLIPPGTYFYKRGNTWNLLDRAFVTKNLLDGKGLDVDLKSYRIYAPDFITEKFVNHFEEDDYGDMKTKSSGFGTPKRYEHKARSAEQAGYSDHFPIVFNLIF
jgi:hypothetical protein